MTMTPSFSRKALRLAAMLALAQLSGLSWAQASYYASNQAGMAFEEIAYFRQGEFDYCLEIVMADALETRTVRDRQGKEFRRWEYRRGASGRLSSVSFFEKGALSGVEQYLSNGRMSFSEEYGPGGLASKTGYSYSGKRLTKAETTDASGAALYSDSYKYSQSGSLREVIRSFPDGSTQSSGVDMADGKLARRWYSQDGSNVIERFDASGAISRRENWNADDPLLVDATSRKDGAAERQVVTDSQRKVKVERLFDASGRISSEVSTNQDGKTLSRTEYAYDAKGRIQKKSLWAGTSKGIVQYTYGTDGQKSLEEHSENGELKKRLVFESESAYWEELLNDGAVAVRVYWKDGWKRKEEILRDGKVVRSRDFK
jgi:hypothetical protein